MPDDAFQAMSHGKIGDMAKYDYIFHHGRRAYPADRVLYYADGTDQKLSLGELEEKSIQFGNALQAKYDIKPSDVVSIFARDSILYPVAYFGFLAAGATLALIPVQNEMGYTDVAARLVQANSKLLITDSHLYDMASTASALADNLPMIVLDQPRDDAPCLDDMLRGSTPSTIPFQIHTNEESNEHIAFLNRTSGSTGNMKSVLTSHAHFIATMEGTRDTVPADTDPDSDVWLSPLSLGFFINAKLHMGLNILLGIPVVLMRSDLDASTIDVVQRHRIGFLFICPPLAANLARADLSHIDMTSVKWLLTAGAPMHEDFRRTISNQFNGVHLTLEWATSETMLIAIQTDESSRKPGSSGTLVTGMEAKELGVSEPGEILVRSSLARFRGYKDNRVANRDFDRGGWFHTGDYGYLDKDCNVYIVDRIKELIRVGQGYGSHVSASELESVVFQHKSVSSVAVVGVRDDALQIDQPTAFVVLKPEYAAGSRSGMAEDIEQYAGTQLTGLRRLTGGVHCIPHFPLTGFKINRRALKAMVPSRHYHDQSAQGQAGHSAGRALLV
ncbi:hypothetical protein AJ80_05171 [Polytolypa hystricis UAMH7299]|uniref:AMP-dependent synthetase/ligase domain-containing protein n=1 Tax=Polytolypa hystricis (strain UAMH7299) TaxID=1447883 RepID=A0A2B7Y4R9_POLH7|nr:hypothetical protein AJ80_05171 [Polytolypa hystricis UAMH7299]